MEKCLWRQCGGGLIFYDGWLHCYKCARDADLSHWEEVERLKARKHGNPKTYGGNYGSHHNPDLEAFVLSKLAKMCRG